MPVTYRVKRNCQTRSSECQNIFFHPFLSHLLKPESIHTRLLHHQLLKNFIIYRVLSWHLSNYTMATEIDMMTHELEKELFSGYLLNWKTHVQRSNIFKALPLLKSHNANVRIWSTAYSLHEVSQHSISNIFFTLLF